mgnify:CR=1 FL=1
MDVYRVIVDGLNVNKMINNQKSKFGTGWIRDLPDLRDYSIQTPKISNLLKGPLFPNLNIPNLTTAPEQIDLRQNCSPIRSQESVGACTSFAACGIFEYLQKVALNKFTQISPLFLYKVTRNQLSLYGDTGATIRGTMSALSMFGICLENNWQYVIDWVNEEPGAFQYAQAQNFKAINYFRLDTFDIDPNTLLEKIKLNLIQGLPILVGFSLYPSFINVKSDGIIPVPDISESVVSGHSIGIYGFDNINKILIIRNSWGENWGDGGYAYLPYYYVLNGIMADFWVMVKTSWIDTSKFI